MIEVRRLRMLTALERLGTVAAVGVELHLTAPGVSMQLAALEREVGVALTERQGRRLTLTPAGRVLAAHGRDVLDRLSLVDLEVDALRRGSVGTYHLAAFPSAARTIVAHAWSDLREDAGLDLRLTTLEPEEALEALMAGRVDLAVVHSYSNVPRDEPDAVDVQSLAREPVLAAVPSGTWAGTVSLSDLADNPWVCAPSGWTCAEMVERACGLAGFRPRVVARTPDFAVQLDLVAAGAGVALIPALATSSIPPGVELLETDPAVHRRSQLVRRRAGQGDPALERIADALRRAVPTFLPRVGA